MPFRTVQTFVGEKIPVSCPGVEANTYVRLWVDEGDTVAEEDLGTAEVSDATVLAVGTLTLSTQPIQQPDGTIIAAGEAALFDLTVTKPGGYTLPSEEYVIVPYETGNGDQRRARQTFSLVDAVEMTGGIMASVFISTGVAYGWGDVAFGWGGVAFGWG